MSQLNPNHVGKTLAATVGILYILCALAYVIIPNTTIALIVYMFHGIDIAKLMTPIQFVPTVLGTIITVVYSYIAGALFGWLWNKLAK